MWIWIKKLRDAIITPDPYEEVELPPERDPNRRINLGLIGPGSASYDRFREAQSKGDGYGKIGPNRVAGNPAIVGPGSPAYANAPIIDRHIEKLGPIPIEDRPPNMTHGARLSFIHKPLNVDEIRALLRAVGRNELHGWTGVAGRARILKALSLTEEDVA